RRPSPPPWGTWRSPTPCWWASGAGAARKPILSTGPGSCARCRSWWTARRPPAPGATRSASRARTTSPPTTPPTWSWPCAAACRSPRSTAGCGKPPTRPAWRPTPLKRGTSERPPPPSSSTSRLRRRQPLDLHAPERHRVVVPAEAEVPDLEVLARVGLVAHELRHLAQVGVEDARAVQLHLNRRAAHYHLHEVPLPDRPQ